MATKGGPEKTKSKVGISPSIPLAPARSVRHLSEEVSMPTGSPPPGAFTSPADDGAMANLLRRRTEASALRMKRRQSRRNQFLTPSTEAFENLQRERSITKYGNLFMDTSNTDRWIPGLIPEDLVQDLYDETRPVDSPTISEVGSSVEVTKSGTVIRRIRKRGDHVDDDDSFVEFPPSEGKSPDRLESPDDIHGWKFRARRKISQWSDKILNKHIVFFETQLERQKTANFINERIYFRIQESLDKLQANIAPFNFKLIWEKDKKFKFSKKRQEIFQNTCGPMIPSDESGEDNEEEEDEIQVDELGRPIYEGFDPKKEFNREDSVYQNLAPPQKKELEAIIKENGNFVMNFNFDVMRHKYPSIVTEFERDKSFDYPGHMEKYAGDRKVLKRAATTAAGIEPESVALVDVRNPLVLDIGLDFPGRIDEDAKPTFVGTHLIGAKRLPIVTKAELASDETKLYMDEFFEYKIQALERELSVQVHLDGFDTAMNMMNSAIDTIQKSLSKSVHPLSGRILAEGIILFRKHLEHIYMADFTKYTIATSEYIKRRNKIQEQISDKRLLGNDYEAIDFEFMEIENTGVTAEIRDEIVELKKLKVYVGNIYEQLKQHRAKLRRLMAELRNVDDGIEVRKQLENTFKETEKISTKESTRLLGYNNFMRMRLRKFAAPEPMEYIRDKATILECETERDKLTIKRDKVEKSVQELSKAQKKMMDFLSTLKPEKKWISPLDNPASDPNFAFRSSKESMKTLKAWGRSVGLLPSQSKKLEIVPMSKSLPTFSSQKTVTITSPSVSPDKKPFLRPSAKLNSSKIASLKHSKASTAAVATGPPIIERQPSLTLSEKLASNQIITIMSPPKLSTPTDVSATDVPTVTGSRTRPPAPSTGRIPGATVPSTGRIPGATTPSAGRMTRAERRASAMESRQDLRTGLQKPRLTLADRPKVIVPTVQGVELMNQTMSTHPHHRSFHNAMEASRQRASKNSLVPVPLALQMAEKAVGFQATKFAPGAKKTTKAVVVVPQRKQTLAGVKVKAMSIDRKGGITHTDY